MKHPKRNVRVGDRDWEIYNLRKYGKTYPEIAQAFGITKQRAQQICTRVDAKMKPPAPLSARTMNCLVRYFDRELKDIHLSEMRALSKEMLLKFPNFGEKSFRELRDWLETQPASGKPKLDKWL